MNIFNEVDKFFSSLTNYLTYNEIFIIFISLALLAIVFTIFTTSKAYEAKLIKTIDMFNKYFIDNPQITEDNLVSFNQTMKSNKVPKQLRKQWQQYVLYRDKLASEYMSFEECVANPIKNSTYKRDIKTFNIISHVLAFVCLIFNAYVAYENDMISVLFQHVLLTPIIILLLNYIVTIFLNIRHNSIVSDLYQNYHYFELNIDKATKTLPDYVDYEVLFDRNEIKRGIPILYAYLQKRAEEEQRELELARIKNVEHERFEFDEAGVAGSLVLERAMHEAENYIAERKKYNQDAEQINSDIGQEDNNYREITKEYNRQMQVSRETFANFKSQLDDASSSIEVNYLKKQQQQELDRQRNLERDFDTATELHKKVIENYHKELDEVDKYREESRKALEEAMMSEFETYSNKVYEEAKKAVEQRELEKTEKLKKQIQDLEEVIVAKDKELGLANNRVAKVLEENENSENELLQQTLGELQQANTQNSTLQQKIAELENALIEKSNAIAELENLKDSYQEVKQEAEESTNSIDESKFEGNESADREQEDFLSSIKEVETEDKSENEIENFVVSSENEDSTEDDDFVAFYDEEIEDDAFVVFEEDQNDELEDDAFADLDDMGKIELSKPKKKAGRPRKEKVETFEPKRKVGRPRKEKVEEPKQEKRRVGRPRKEKIEEPVQEKRKVGRPKKQVAEQPKQEKKRVGRPRKEKVEVAESKRKVGRPKKEKAEEPKQEKRRVGRPKKQVAEQPKQEKKKAGRPKKQTVVEEKPKKKAGRPKKGENPKGDNGSSLDIDAYLKEINAEIEKENKKLEKAKKELSKKAKLNKKK